jgi:cyclophilin family peptidyl-prolyl cis-trans isomerase
MSASRVSLMGLVVLMCVVLVASVAAGQEDQKSASSTTSAQTAEVKKDEKQEAKPVMATLTYIVGGKKLTKQVPYLPEGRKIATMETNKGTVKIELWEDKAPNTVVNFVSLANAGKYDGVAFHRVIDGFMAQTGDVEHKNGTGGPGYTIPAEFNEDLKHVRGVVSMARASDPDSGGSQFFIMFAAAPHLDGKYAAFGKVIEGMDVIDSLKKGASGSGAVSNPDKIIKLRVESVPQKKAAEEEKK